MSARLFRGVVALATATGVAGLGLAACSTKSNDGGSANDKVTITVDCQPVGSQADLLANWNADVEAFEKDNPTIDIKSVSVGTQCNNPPDFTARLQGGTVTDLFYGYMTDLGQVLDSGQAMDITEYVGADTISTWDSVDAAAKAAFTDGEKVYAVPTKNYSMGLVYNKNLFQRAGLDAKNPPRTWAEVRAAAKKIAGLGNGIAGYAEYSAGNTGGWHYTAELYSLGGRMVTPDGKKADFNNPLGKQVLQNFLWPKLVMPSPETRTVSVGIYAFSGGTPMNVVVAAAVIAAVPTVVFFLVFQKSIMSGLTAGSLKG
jgi:multiple sugar transport system substrate-binding protein